MSDRRRGQYVRGGGGAGGGGGGPAPVPVVLQHGAVPVPVPVRGGFPPPGGQIVIQAGPTPPPGGAHYVIQQLEQKLQVQHAEFQQLLTENQRLAATHVALRQELAAAQGEIQKLRQDLGEKDVGLRQLVEKSNKLQADLRATDTLRAELQGARAELQAAVGRRQELEQARAAQALQMQQMQQDIQRMRAELQVLPAMQQDLQGMQAELQGATQAIEFHKKNEADILQQRNSMETNLVNMAREVERLKAELANVPKQEAPGFIGYNAPPSYGAPYGYDSYPSGPPLYSSRAVTPAYPPASLGPMPVAVPHEQPLPAGTFAYAVRPRGPPPPRGRQ